MKAADSSLEKHAVALGLNSEDVAPVQRVKPPVATSDKVLLGLGCCVFAAGSAALSIWMVVPTLFLSCAAAALLVRHLHAANAASHSRTMGPGLELDGAAVFRSVEDEQEGLSTRNRNIALDPVFRTTPSNIYYYDYHHRR